MGYFSNGEEGEAYRKKWCDRCLHDNLENSINCRVWVLHYIFNYPECDKLDSFLHVLIPLSKDGLGNERCSMFVERNLLSNLAIQKYESDTIE